jgi:hypothetical protein
MDVELRRHIGTDIAHKGEEFLVAVPGFALAHDLAGVENSMDMTRCWTIARHLHIGTAHLLGCRACEVLYLIADHSRFDRTCPICALYRAYSDAPPTPEPDPDNAFARSLLLPPERALQHWLGELRPSGTEKARRPIPRPRTR